MLCHNRYIEKRERQKKNDEEVAKAINTAVYYYIVCNTANNINDGNDGFVVYCIYVRTFDSSTLATYTNMSVYLALLCVN